MCYSNSIHYLFFVKNFYFMWYDLSSSNSHQNQTASAFTFTHLGSCSLSGEIILLKHTTILTRSFK